MASPERILWSRLRVLKQQGLRFRRQAPIGSYITDFACFSKKLVIELDGETHGNKTAILFDQHRDAFLREQGFRVLRFLNTEVMYNCSGVVEAILNEVRR